MVGAGEKIKRAVIFGDVNRMASTRKPVALDSFMIVTALNASTAFYSANPRSPSQSYSCWLSFVSPRKTHQAADCG